MMEQMDFNDIRALLSALVDGEIDDAKRHEAERLIAQCDEARALMDEAEALDVLIARDAELLAGEPTTLPPGFEASVLAQTVEADRIAYGRRWTTWLGWVAAAACLTLAITIWVMDRQHWLSESLNSNAVAKDTPGDDSDGDGSNDRIAPGGGMQVHFTKRSWTIDTPLDQPNPHAPEIPVKQPIASAPSGFASLGADADEQRGTADTAPQTDAARKPLHALPFRANGFAAMPEQAGENHAPVPPATVHALNEADAKTLLRAAALLEQLAMAETDTFRDVELIRRNVERDDMLERLAQARARVDATNRPMVLAAESVLLRIARGPLSQDDLRLMRDDVQQLDLAAQLHGLTGTATEATSF